MKGESMSLFAKQLTTPEGQIYDVKPQPCLALADRLRGIVDGRLPAYAGGKKQRFDRQ